MLGLTAVTGPGCWNGPPPQPWHPFQGSSCAFLFKTYYFEVIPNVEESRENSVENSCVSRTWTSRSLASYSRLLILSVRVCLPERFEDGCRRAARRSEAQSACVLKTRAVAPVAPVQNRRVRPARRRPRVRRPVAVPAQGETPRDSCVWGPQLRCRLSEGGVVVPRVRVQKQHCSESGTRFSPAGSPLSQARGSEVPMACSVLMP